MQANWSNYKQLVKLTHKHRQLLVYAVLASLFAAFLDALLINFIKDIVNQGFVKHDQKFLTYFPIYILTFFAFRAMGGYLCDYLTAKSSRIVMRDQRLKFTNHMLNVSKSFFDAESLGHIQASFSYKIEQVANAATITFLSYIREGFLIGLLLLIMFIESWQLTLMAMVSMPIVLTAYRMTALKLRQTNSKVQNQIGQMTQMTGQVFSSVGDIGAYDQKSFFKGRFGHLLESNYQSEISAGHYTAFLSASLYVVTAVPLALMMYWVNVTGHFPTVGSFTALLAAMLRIIQPLKIISQLTSDLQKALVANRDLDSYYALGAYHANMHIASENQISINGSFQLSSGETLIRHLDVSIHAGQKVAIVGPSGAGKSTFLQVLAGIYSLNGSVNLGRSQAYVRQEAWVFNGSVRENLIFNQNHSDEQIWECLKQVNLESVIRNLPKQLDTPIGQGDMILSGGEQQRLCLARALLKAPDWLLLDEITSALDRVSEGHILDALFSSHCGVVMVTHRLKHLDRFDRVLFLSGGNIIADGPFDKIVDDNNSFKDFYHHQQVDMQSESQVQESVAT